MEFINIYISENLIVDILGWIGGIALVIAFGLNSYGKIAATGARYQILNSIGAVFLILNSTYYGAFPSTFVNVVWLCIAFVSLWNIFRKKEG